jgi:aryl-alcohol dehydrogenase-like predicted oxidoreductase
VNWIDTAAAYGFGRSEQLVGRALKGLDQRPYAFTKASRADQVDPIFTAATIELTRDEIEVRNG